MAYFGAISPNVHVMDNLVFPEQIILKFMEMGLPYTFVTRIVQVRA